MKSYFLINYVFDEEKSKISGFEPTLITPKCVYGQNIKTLQTGSG